MRYIRTKDGKIWSFSNPNNNFLYEGRSKKNGKWVHEIGEVVKEADTIEELCDCFVKFRHEVYNIDRITIRFKYEFVGIYKRFSKARKGLRYRDFSDILYGAVWTDKGLIYVAKFNKEGEFDLL